MGKVHRCSSIELTMEISKNNVNVLLNYIRGRMLRYFEGGFCGVYSGPRKIGIASLLNLTLEETGTLKRGEEYEAVRVVTQRPNHGRRVSCRLEGAGIC